MNGKGDKKRPAQISQAEQDLRWEYAYSDTMTTDEFDKRLKEIRSANK